MSHATPVETRIEAALAALDQLVRERSILDHPFYRAWRAGELDRGQLATYAAQYFPHVRAFPEYLESAIAVTTDPEVRHELRDNLREELSVPAPHPDLWLDFAGAVGADREALAATIESAASRDCVAAFRNLSARSSASALAALYAYESQQPAVAAEKMAGLRELYGIDDEKALAYFAVHAEADVRHREGERRGLARCLETGATDEQEILAAAGQALDAYWSLLDGVCRETGVSLEMPVEVPLAIM